MTKIRNVLCAVTAILLCCAPAVAADEPFAEMEERIAAEMEAVIDATGQLSEEDEAACRKLVQEGIREHDKGEYGKAIELYEKALKKNPVSAIAYYEIGFSNYAAGENQKALDALLRSLVLDPKSEEAHVMKANILDDLGFTEDAIASYRKIIGLKPGSFTGRLNLGIALLRKGDAEQAHAEFMEAHRIDPEHPSPFFQLSRVARTKDEAYEEERYLTEFVRRGKNDRRLPMVEQRLKELKTVNLDLRVSEQKDPASEALARVGMLEGLQRALWRGEKHRKTFPDAKGYSPSFEEELDVMKSALEAWAEEKGKNADLADPAYDMAAAANGAGYLEEYVWFANRAKLGPKAEAWIGDNKPRMDAFAGWAEKSGYRAPVGAGKETGGTKQSPSIDVRALPGIILKAAEQSKLTYEIGTGTPEDGAKFRKKERDRYRDLFKNATGQCIGKKEARKALSDLSGSTTSDAYVSVFRVFMPGDDEWEEATRMASRFGSRYRDLAPPLAMSGSIEKKDNKIAIKLADTAWIPYFMAKALWRYEPGFRQRFGGGDSDAATLAEEELALAALVGGHRNAKEAKDRKEPPEALVEAIDTVFSSRRLTGFVLMEILHKTYGVSLECLPSSHAQILRAYFPAHALERLQAAP